MVSPCFKIPIPEAQLLTYCNCASGMPATLESSWLSTLDVYKRQVYSFQEGSPVSRLPAYSLISVLQYASAIGMVFRIGQYWMEPADGKPPHMLDVYKRQYRTLSFLYC